jgi:hypothetical protein
MFFKKEDDDHLNFIINENSYRTDISRQQLFEPLKDSIELMLKKHCDFLTPKQHSKFHRYVITNFTYFQTLPHPYIHEFNKKDGLCLLTAMRVNRVARLFESYVATNKVCQKDGKQQDKIGDYVLAIYIAFLLCETNKVSEYFKCLFYKKSEINKLNLHRVINTRHLDKNDPYLSCCELPAKMIFDYQRIADVKNQPVTRIDLMYQIFGCEMVGLLSRSPNIYYDILDFFYGHKSNWISQFKKQVDQDILKHAEKNFAVDTDHQYGYISFKESIDKEKEMVKSKQEDVPVISNKNKVLIKSTKKSAENKNIINDELYTLDGIKVHSKNTRFIYLIEKVNADIKINSINLEKSNMFVNVDSNIIYIPFKLIRDCAKQHFKITPETYISYLTSVINEQKMLKLINQDQGSAFFCFDVNYFYQGINGLEISKEELSNQFKLNVISITEYIKKSKIRVEDKADENTTPKVDSSSRLVANNIVEPEKEVIKDAGIVDETTETETHTLDF